MLSFCAATTHIVVWPKCFTSLSPLSCSCTLFECSSRTGAGKKKELCVPLHLAVKKDTRGSFLGFLDVRRRDCRDWLLGCGANVRKCKQNWESEGNSALEAEILEFMKNSGNSEMFPSKKQLIDAGRMDLVKAVMKQGGWLAFGWHMEDDEKEEKEVLGDVDVDLGSMRDNECDNAVAHEDEEVFGDVIVDLDSRSLNERDNAVVQESVLEGNEEQRPENSVLDANLLSPASSTGRTLKIAANDEPGIEGILNRLEKERNMSLGLLLGEKGSSAPAQSFELKHEGIAKTSKNAMVAGLRRSMSLNHNNSVINDSEVKHGQGISLSNIDSSKNSLKPDTWRSWSAQRAGFSAMEFEAAEITFMETNTGFVHALGDEIRESANESLDQRQGNSFHEGSNHVDIRGRLQHLQSELSTVLYTLKSNTIANVPQKMIEEYMIYEEENRIAQSQALSSWDHENSNDNLLKLSDDSEFQENEIMSARDKVRSIQAKLAVLEGKMALAIIDAQKIVEQKQRKVDDARRALQLLRTACIVWPTAATEVLLMGSFDGWTTQRKMERSNKGVFSLYLKLYPGKYEIKFIVDGEWKIDPLRPVVHNNGYENNLLIIT